MVGHPVDNHLHPVVVGSFHHLAEIVDITKLRIHPLVVAHGIVASERALAAIL